MKSGWKVGRNCVENAFPATDGTACLANIHANGGAMYSIANAIAGTEDDIVSSPVAVATGPLVADSINPRYFKSSATNETIYLTGSHTWNNLQDIGAAFDYVAYLDLMHNLNHNFMRMWVWEAPKGTQWASVDKEFTISPTPFVRTGPGNAEDGLLKYDLNRFNQPYFDRLRARVIAARDQGIYVSIMLFQGWNIEHKLNDGLDQANPWKYHPFNLNNNINVINANSDGDDDGTKTHTLQIPAITTIQKAYVAKVIDTVNDLDNVLYEISNESGSFSTDWQYHFIKHIKQYEANKPKQHPVGMTFQHSEGSNNTLFNSPADWISPNAVGGYDSNPPVADGSKVMISDTDHIWGIGGSREWVWKSFLRGLNPIFMDTYDSSILTPESMGYSNAQIEEVRKSMGDTLSYAKRINLVAMTPQNSLSSTAYCLANPGSEYLIYQPSSGSFTVDLQAGTYQYEWFNPDSGRIIETNPIVVAGGDRSFIPPFRGEAVLYLKLNELAN